MNNTDPCPAWCTEPHEPADGHYGAVIEDGLVRVDIGEGNFGRPLIGASVLEPRGLTPAEGRRFAAAIVRAADLAEGVQR